MVRCLGERLSYVSGSSGPTDDAIDTLLSGQGVCRDSAHLSVTVCRTLAIPARFVSVYAAGLAPMDFHAVFEAAVDGHWHLFDATGIAPRPSMTRVATGRDAAEADIRRWDRAFEASDAATERHLLFPSTFGRGGPAPRLPPPV